VLARASRGPRLASGRRPRGFLDDVELVVAHLVGHTLSPLQSLVVQLRTLVIVFALFLLFVTSGLFQTLAGFFAHLILSQIRAPGATPAL
jgi:hypothetical protein